MGVSFPGRDRRTDVERAQRTARASARQAAVRIVVPMFLAIALTAYGRCNRAGPALDRSTKRASDSRPALT